jgi:phosphatidyl-myo-inositol dimannoside synthase
MRKPRVLLGADSLQRGASGIGRVARLMAKVLGEQVRAGRIEAQAVALRGPPPTDLGIDVRSARGSQALFMAEMHRAALTHSHFMYDFAGIARAHPRVWPLARPYLCWLHGIEIWEEARADRLARGRSATVLLANTAYTRDRASALHAGLERAEVCWLATEEDEAPAGPRERDIPTVLVLSRLDGEGGYKGHRELITAWPRVHAAIAGARLLIAGDGPGRSVIRAWAETSPARGHIDLLGFVEEREIESLWHKASILAMPSRGEGFGLTYIEAMRRGLPVLASTHDAGSEVNVHGKTGYNVDLDQPDALAEALIALLADGAERDRLGAEGRTRWETHFAFSVFRKRFVPHLENLLRS